MCVCVFAWARRERERERENPTNTLAFVIMATTITQAFRQLLKTTSVPSSSLGDGVLLSSATTASSSSSSSPSSAATVHVGSGSCADGSGGGLYSDGRIYKFIRFYPSSSRLAITRAVRALTLINNDVPPSTNVTTNDRSFPQPFQTMIVDKDEITLMVCNDDWKRVEHQMSSLDNVTNVIGGEGGVGFGGTEMTTAVEDKSKTDFNIEISSIDYRLITFNVDLAPTLVGFMAFVTEKLATAQVSVLPFGAYSKDHIFVSTKDFDKAMAVLQNAAVEAAASEL